MTQMWEHTDPQVTGVGSSQSYRDAGASRVEIQKHRRTRHSLTRAEDHVCVDQRRGSPRAETTRAPTALRTADRADTGPGEGGRGRPGDP